MRIFLEQMLEINLDITNKGKLPNYIPALNKEENKNDLGLCIINSEGNHIGLGDYKKTFTIQSISKVLTLMLAIKDNGIDEVFRKVGYEGTDEPFNTLIKLDVDKTIKPANPMLNSGALVITSLIKGKGDKRYKRILEFIKEITKNPSLSLNEEIYLSELDANDRNRAIAYLLKSKNMIDGDVDEILDVYCRQCSIEVNTVDLAYIGQYISTGCRNLLDNAYDNNKVTKIIKGILLACGMYDYSTEYSIKVGIPSKSGVGGGIMGVLPDGAGIGLYGPSLDSYGNSIGGVKLLEDISTEYGYNIFENY